MSPRHAAAAVEPEPRRHGVFGALAAALPDRAPRRGAQDRPDLTVVAPAARRRRTWQVGTVAGALIFVAMFLIIGAQTLIVQQQRHLDSVDARIAEAEKDAEQLKIDLAELQSPERIIGEAEDRLGMVPAPTPVYLQPQAGDDARAAEVPEATPTTTIAPPTTVATSSASSKSGSGTTSASGGSGGKGTTATTAAGTGSGR